MTRVVVIGGGIAGTGAAVAASSAGASVVLVDGGPGASSLATGAIDLVDWRRPQVDVSVPPEVATFLSASGAYTLAPRALLVTTAGTVRPAWGYDSALIDVSVPEGGRVAVVACDRPRWNARVLARAWGELYEVIDATVLRHADERVIPDVDFAARHDDAQRLGWLGERLRDAVARHRSGFDRIVLPPCLGVERGRAGELSAHVGVRCGEATALPGGPAGLRFERARGRMLSAAGVEVLRARATAVERTQTGWCLSADNQRIDAAAVVVATGGLLGGGIEYGQPQQGAAADVGPQPALRLSLRCPLALGLQGRTLEASSSTFGQPPEGLAWPWTDGPTLEQAGAIVDPDGGSPSPGLFAAGDLVADAPRTWLRALASGLRAGAAAGRVTDTARH
jgi:anaerobic glycerol-3-phosphate dehydrogenase